MKATFVPSVTESNVSDGEYRQDVQFQADIDGRTYDFSFELDIDPQVLYDLGWAHFGGDEGINLRDATFPDVGTVASVGNLQFNSNDPITPYRLATSTFVLALEQNMRRSVSFRMDNC